MPTEILIAVLVVAAACVGVIVYAAFFSDETPEGFQRDAEHDSAGKPLPTTSLHYKFVVAAEGLISRPAAWLRKLFGFKTP